MTAPETALRHQRLEAREAQLRNQIERMEAQLARDPEVERLEREASSVEAAGREVDLRLIQREREAEARRVRVRARERELMSGRISSPSELMRLSGEVEHLKAALSEEEDAEMQLLEEQERLQKESRRVGAELEAARSRVVSAAPGLQQGLQRLREELAETERERESAWSQLPADWQKAYTRVLARIPNPVAEVVRAQCQACHVSVTSNGMQVLRRAGLVVCDNCGRLLVVA
jgi:predicted  nucleic acid-binding Zn-ribbon protein